MADKWLIDITHLLDGKGELITEPPQAARLAEYFTAIIAMASHPEPEYPPEYRVSCRRKPNRKPCLTEIVGFIDPETDEIVWMCPKCKDEGRISNWRGSIWDMNESDGETAH